MFSHLPLPSLQRKRLLAPPVFRQIVSPRALGEGRICCLRPWRKPCRRKRLHSRGWESPVFHIWTENIYFICKNIWTSAGINMPQPNTMPDKMPEYTRDIMRQNVTSILWIFFRMSESMSDRMLDRTSDRMTENLRTCQNIWQVLFSFC